MMKPLMFLAVIAGGVSGSFTFQLLGAGLRAPASPGSIIAILAMTPFNSVMSVVSVLAGIAVGAGVSFIVAAAILKADAKDTVDNFEEKVQQTQAAKLSSKGLAAQPMTGINRIIFACDAGMGSSAMGHRSYVKSQRSGSSTKCLEFRHQQFDGRCQYANRHSRRIARTCQTKRQMRLLSRLKIS